MKFGKRLKIHLKETLPEWRDKFVAYKQLKKRLKLLKSAPDCFAEVAFIPATESADSNVARVDSMLRNGSEIGHYGNRLQLGRFPEALEEPEQQVGSRGSAAASSGTRGGGAAVAVRDPEYNVAGRGEEVRPGPGGQQQGRQEVVSESRKRKCRPSSDDSDGEVDGPFENGHISSDQMEFINLLYVELRKLNNFFIEKEDRFVMELQALKEAAARMKERTGRGTHLSEEDTKEMTKIFTEMIAFHGEMVLLETYSSLNYTGLVKILKKHDKWTGGVLRMSFIETVLRQPFFTTELLSQLVKDCEVNLSSLFPLPTAGQAVQGCDDVQASENSSGANASDSESGLHGATSPASGDGTSTVLTGDDAEGAPHRDYLDSVYRSCEAALETMMDIRRGSSTYSALSMPPLDPPDDDDSLGVVINEQSSRDSPTPCRGVSVSQE